jgi:hypothetical protein
MKIYERIYDNPLDKNKKENKLLGEFELIDGDMNDYSYQVIVKSNKDKELYILHGREISGFYNPGMGGTKHLLEKLTKNRFVKAYIKFN